VAPCVEGEEQDRACGAEEQGGGGGELGRQLEVAVEAEGAGGGEAEGSSSPIRGVMNPPSGTPFTTEEPGVAVMLDTAGTFQREAQEQQQQQDSLLRFSLGTSGGGLPPLARAPTVPALSLGHSIKPSM
jgi:hypothetical protein